MEESWPLIKIAGEHWIPLIKVTESPNGTVEVGGPMGYMIQILSHHLKFRYEVIRGDGSWGVKKANGEWMGMIGMLARNEVEFALGPFMQSPGRAEVSNFSTALYTDREVLITPRPSIQSDFMGLIKPFTLQVWMLVLVSMVSIMGAMVVLVKGEGHIFGHKPMKVVGHAGLWVLQTFTQESSEWMPRRDGGRLLVVTWLLASLVFMTSYSGILTAMLTVPKVTIPIDSLEDLVAQSTIPWRLEGGAMMFDFFNDSDKKEHKLTLAGVSGTISDCWSGREGLVAGEYAAVCDETTERKVLSWDFSNTGRCRLYITKETIYFSELSMAFRLHSSYREGANRIVQKLVEGGIITHWLSTELANATECLRPPSSVRRKATQALSLQAFLGPVFMILAGWTLALHVFVAEHVITYLSSSK